MSTIKGLAPEGVYQLIAAQLRGDGVCGDTAMGLYIDAVVADDRGVNITVGDESGEDVTFALAAVSPQPPLLSTPVLGTRDVLIVPS